VIPGLATALGWGLADLFAALSGRRIGSWATVLIANLSAALVISIVLVVVQPSFDGMGAVVGWLIPNSVLVVLAYLSLYRALELGPLAILSPMLASYALIPIVLSVVVLGESLTALQVAGTVVTILGAMLTSTDLRAVRAGTHRMPEGLPWGVAAAVLFGVATFTIGWASQQASAIPVLWLARTVAATILLVGAAGLLVARGRVFAGPVAASAVTIPLLLGAVDVLGTLAYSYGAETGLVSLVSAVSAIYPVIPVLGGVRLFGERPAPSQYAGIALVVLGLGLLGAA
jgi:drug/metabolite transporter (DMT)-like permease